MTTQQDNPDHRQPEPEPQAMRDLRKLVEEPIPPGQEVLMQLRLAAWKRHLYTKDPLPPELEGWDTEP